MSVIKKGFSGYIEGVECEDNSTYHVPEAVLKLALELKALLVELDLPLTVTVRNED